MEFSPCLLATAARAALMSLYSWVKFVRLNSFMVFGFDLQCKGNNYFQNTEIFWKIFSKGLQIKEFMKNKKGRMNGLFYSYNTRSEWVVTITVLTDSLFQLYFLVGSKIMDSFLSISGENCRPGVTML